jgi:hypothetical protein
MFDAPAELVVFWLCVGFTFGSIFTLFLVGPIHAVLSAILRHLRR